jgi:TetR/AcrR family transcriptional regulator, transcriptional repressor for nem operon
MPTDARQLRRQQSHERILDATAQELYRSGIAGVGVADVMRRAGLTHGGFYAHFASREALLVEAIDHAGRRSNAALAERLRRHAGSGKSALRMLVEEYLSEAHMETMEAGCTVAALGSEMTRSSDGLRDASVTRVHALVALVGDALPPHAAPGSAAVIAATMAGAMQMARVLGKDGGGLDILQACAASLLAQYDGAASP